MAQPTVDEILTLTYSLDGSPWVQVAATGDVSFGELTYSLDGSPFVGIESTASAVTFIPIIMYI